MPDEFGARMKRYERTTKHILSPRTHTIVRVDGRAFHTYLRGAERPFDQTVIDAMDATAIALCTEMAGARFAYTQSDEISVLLTDLDPKSQPWFAGEIQKIASVSASIATMAFNRYYPGTDPDRLGRSATFYARVYTIPSRIEVANYFLWRQKDAIRNAVSMAASAYFSPKQLHGKSVAQQQEMLFGHFGINFKTAYGARKRRGGVVTRQTYTHTSPSGKRYLSPEGGVLVLGGEGRTVTRHRWAPRAAANFTLDNGGFLAQNIPQEPADALQPVVSECRASVSGSCLSEAQGEHACATEDGECAHEGWPSAKCLHEAWETCSDGTPHKCADCGDVFTVQEAADILARHKQKGDRS